MQSVFAFFDRREFVLLQARVSKEITQAAARVPSRRWRVERASEWRLASCAVESASKARRRGGRRPDECGVRRGVFSSLVPSLRRLEAPFVLADPTPLVPRLIQLRSLRAERTAECERHFLADPSLAHLAETLKQLRIRSCRMVPFSLMEGLP